MDRVGDTIKTLVDVVDETSAVNGELVEEVMQEPLEEEPLVVVSLTLFSFLSSLLRSLISFFSSATASFFFLQVSSSVSFFFRVSWISFSFILTVLTLLFTSSFNLQILSFCAFRDFCKISHSFLFFSRLRLSTIVCCSKLLLDFSRDLFSVKRFSTLVFHSASKLFCFDSCAM